MRRILLIKTSSLGDVIHTLPALSDARTALGDVRFDWVVEEGFVQIPRWHPAVDRVIPVGLRRWRKQGWLGSLASGGLIGEWRELKRQMHSHRLDAVIDAQGLIKSALITRQAHGSGIGPRYGLDKHSARESLSARVLDRPIAVPRDQHAVQRVRQLFAASLGYPLPVSPSVFAPDYGLDRAAMARSATTPYLVFLHGTTWASKRYPLIFWRELCERANTAGYAVKLPWGNTIEHLHAQKIAQPLLESGGDVEVLPSLDLQGMAGWLAGASGVVATDTGLGHLAAALGVPQVSVYSSTDPARTGALGQHQAHLAVSGYGCAPCMQRRCNHPVQGRSLVDPPCFESLPPQAIVDRLLELIDGAATH